MAFKPNYRFERAERDRAKKAKKEEKLRRRQDRAAPQQDAIPPEPTEEKDRTES
jgi:hypothetical protein